MSVSIAYKADEKYDLFNAALARHFNAENYRGRTPTDLRSRLDDLIDNLQ